MKNSNELKIKTIHIMKKRILGMVWSLDCKKNSIEQEKITREIKTTKITSLMLRTLTI